MHHRFNDDRDFTRRAEHLLAVVRHRQLATARAGRLSASFHYAGYARRIRAKLDAEQARRWAEQGAPG